MIPVELFTKSPFKMSIIKKNNPEFTTVNEINNIEILNLYLMPDLRCIEALYITQYTFSVSLLLSSLETTHLIFISREVVTILSDVCWHTFVIMEETQYQESVQPVSKILGKLCCGKVQPYLTFLTRPLHAAWCGRVHSTPQDLWLPAICAPCLFGLARSCVGPAEEEWRTSPLLELPRN